MGKTMIPASVSEKLQELFMQKRVIQKSLYKISSSKRSLVEVASVKYSLLKKEILRKSMQ
jgi:hypothetical protein